MRPILAALTLGLIVSAALSADPPAKRRADQEALKPYGGLVGEWKGTGMPQRGSAKGSWTEKGGWAWKLSDDSAAMELSVEKGKYLKSATLRPGPKKGTFRLETKLVDGGERTFVGKAGARNVLTLTAEKDAESGPARITITPLHDTRFLMLLQSKDASGDHARLGEVGYTRQGVAFAAGDATPACIVTEGRGTIAVKHKGQTYYVCCSGCKDLFEEKPDEILAEAAQRAKDKAKAK